MGGRRALRRRAFLAVALLAGAVALLAAASGQTRATLTVSQSALPQAQVSVFHHKTINIGPGVDSFGPTTPTDARGWYDIRIDNNGQTPVPQPTISVDGATATTFSPPYNGGFPATVTAPGDLGPGQELRLNAFAGLDQNTPGENLTGVVTGADVSRSSTVSPDGTVLIESLTATLTDTSLAGGGIQIEVDPYNSSQQSNPATLDLAHVTLPNTSNGEYQFQAGSVGQGGFRWAINGGVVGKPYTLTIPINLNGLPAASYKPRVNFGISPAPNETSVTANSTTLHDAELGGTVTYSAAAGALVQWQSGGDSVFTDINFAGSSLPQAQAEVDHTISGFLQPGSSDTLTATTPINMRGFWRASIRNVNLATVPAPSISLDGETAPLDPPYLGNFPNSVGAAADLQSGQELDWTTFSPGPGPAPPPSQNLVGYQTGFDVTRSRSVNAAGTVLTETVSVTLRDAAYAGGGLDITVRPQNQGTAPDGAALELANVTLPDMSGGEHQFFGNVEAGSFEWNISGAVRDKPYILTVPIDLNGLDGTAYKPSVSVNANTFAPGTSTTGTSTTIHDADLGGTFTFAAGGGALVQWSTQALRNVGITFSAQGAYTLSLAPSSATVAAGDIVQTQLTLANPNWTGNTGAFLQQVNADGSLAQPPQGVYIQNQGAIQFSAPATQPVTINTDPNTPQGTYNLVVVSNDGTNTQAPFTLTVGPPLPEVGFGFGSFTQFSLDSSIDSVGATDQLTGNQTWNAGLNVFGTVGLPQAQITLPNGRHDLSPPVPYPLSAGPTDLTPGGGLGLPVSVADPNQQSSLSVTAAPLIAVERTSSSGSWTLPAGGGVETVTVRVTPTQPTDNFQIRIVARDDNGNFWGTIDAAHVVAPPGDNVSVSGGRLDWQSNSSQPDATYTFVVPIDVPTGGTFKPVVNVQTGSGVGQGSNGVGSSATLTDPTLGGTVTFSWGGRAQWNGGLNSGRGVFLAPVDQPVVAPITTTLNVTVLGTDGAPAGGAFVQACAAGLFGCHAAAADANGVATITGDVPAGTGPLQVSLTGSATNASAVDGPFTVTPGDSVSRTLNLHSLVAPPADVTITDRGTTSTGAPLVPIHQAVQVAADGCANGTATYAIARGAIQLAAGSLAESPAGSGQYSASGISIPFASGSGPATVTIAIACPSPADNRSVAFDVVYVDPSGTVETTSGAPIAGATVTLYRSDSGAPGSFAPVPNGSTLLSPDNRTNPDHSDAAGSFGWNVVPGFYYVHASAPGCTPADSPVSEVPPAVTGIVLKLACASPPSPEAAIQLNPTTRSIVVSGRGATLVSTTPLGGGQVKYVLAGGPGQSVVLVLKSSAQGQTLDGQIVSLQYGGGPVQTPTATLHYDWSLNKNGTIKQLHQDLKVGDGQTKQHLNAQFDGAKNETALDGGGAGHSAQAGLVILRIATAAGALSIQH
jgi:hypothetical protein